MSFKVEMISATYTEWHTTSMRFATRDEALRFARDIAQQDWIIETRIAETSDPVTDQYIGDGIVKPPKERH